MQRIERFRANAAGHDSGHMAMPIETSSDSRCQAANDILRRLPGQFDLEEVQKRPGNRGRRLGR